MIFAFIDINHQVIVLFFTIHFPKNRISFHQIITTYYYEYFIVDLAFIISAKEKIFVYKAGVSYFVYVYRFRSAGANMYPDKFAGYSPASFHRRIVQVSNQKRS